VKSATCTPWRHGGNGGVAARISKGGTRCERSA